MIQCSSLFACRLTPHDSARYWGRFEADTYDCVLLDAPCTSERHVIQQAASDSGKGANLRWSVRQCEDMAALQVRLLTAALKVSNVWWYRSCLYLCMSVCICACVSVPMRVRLCVPETQHVGVCVESVECGLLPPHISWLTSNASHLVFRLSCLTFHASHLVSHISCLTRHIPIYTHCYDFLGST